MILNNAAQCPVVIAPYNGLFDFHYWARQDVYPIDLGNYERDWYEFE